MSLEKFIEDAFGKPIREKFVNRLRGGKNNKKGNTYENYFAVHQAAKIYSEGKLNPDSVKLFHQADALVDDLVVLDEERNSRFNHQLKTSPSITWGSVADDFSQQHRIDTEFHGCDISISFLVVPGKQTHDQLNKKIPAGISDYSECLHFKGESFNSEALNEDSEITPFRNLCSYPEDIDKVTTVWRALLGAWAAQNEDTVSITVDELVTQAAKYKEPGFFRLQSEWEPSAELLKGLDKIANLHYKVLASNLILQATTAGGRFEILMVPNTPQYKVLENLISNEEVVCVKELCILLFEASPNA